MTWKQNKASQWKKQSNWRNNKHKANNLNEKPSKSNRINNIRSKSLEGNENQWISRECRNSGEISGNQTDSMKIIERSRKIWHSTKNKATEWIQRTSMKFYEKYSNIDQYVSKSMNTIKMVKSLDVLLKTPWFSSPCEWFRFAFQRNLKSFKMTPLVTVASEKAFAKKG